MHMGVLVCDSGDVDGVTGGIDMDTTYQTKIHTVHLRKSWDI